MKFTTSEEPYPTPFEDRLVDTIDPLTIGWMIASNVSDPTEEIPTSPMIWTETSVKFKLWTPDPKQVKFTYCLVL